MDRLKPCPFCGGKSQVEKRNSGYQVRCLSCGARSGYVVASERSELKRLLAIESWNRRADDGQAESN